MSLQRLAIIIPAYNELDALEPFLRSLVSELDRLLNLHAFSLKICDIVIVDDGSTSSVGKRLGEPSACSPVLIHLLRHPTNLGQGAAIQTGIEYARDELNASLFATMDADGQHSEKDLEGMIATLIENKLDIVFGNRFAGKKNNSIPFSRLLLLKTATLFEKIICGLALGDAHNGFRVFNRTCASSVQLKLNRMAHATEFKQIVRKHSLRYGEAPVQIVYSDSSLAKGQRNSGAFIILKDLALAYLFNR